MCKPAIFLDRDGVLCVEKSYVTKVEDLEIFPYARESVTILHELGYYAIVITNQSAVARGMLLEKDLLMMNEKLKCELDVDEVYYCPHYPNGKNPFYSKVCDCRKPKIGLIQKACSEYQIDLENSYMVGDRSSDILLGMNVGIKTVLVQSGYGTQNLEEKVSPDLIFEGLRDFAEYLLEKERKSKKF